MIAQMTNDYGESVWRRTSKTGYRHWQIRIQEQRGEIHELQSICSVLVSVGTKQLQIIDTDRKLDAFFHTMR